MHRVFRSRWVLSGLSVTAGVGIGATLTATGDRLNKIRDTSHSSGLLERIPVIPIPSVDAASEITPYQPGQVTVSSSTAVMKYGFPSLSNIKSRESYVTSYDPQKQDRSLGHRAAQRRDSNRDSDRKYCDFKRTTRFLFTTDRGKADYKGSGFDRGQLAAAANHKLESESQWMTPSTWASVTTGERSHCITQLLKLFTEVSL